MGFWPEPGAPAILADAVQGQGIGQAADRETVLVSPPWMQAVGALLPISQTR